MSKADFQIMTRTGRAVPTSTLAVHVRSDLYERTISTEDGPERAIFERFSVVAEAADGSRWAYRTDWAEHDLGRGPAERLAGDFAASLRRVAATGRWVGPRGRSWTEVEPCYGSEAYAADWRRHEAAASLADGDYEPGTQRAA